ncbi:MAG: D-alanyl-D-alanine carboxypeptidase [Christensenellaceae bacterium]|jgi:D-alanyl-D-alanine carboxypeptidase (penicillin-binding protein 5/6)|nr:D-alanyl-D-alanine carboxypeptidase [Christensenellaceae bacterium]
MKKISTIIFSLLLMLLLLLSSNLIASAEAHKKKPNESIRIGKSACLIDFDNGIVLYERNADERAEIASMVKIMTLLLTFDMIEKGELYLDQKQCVSENASGMGGSQMYIKSGQEYTIEELIKGIIIISANDASVAIAEAIAGSEMFFVKLMNQKAEEMGMTDTHFTNVTGLPDENQYSTARNVTIMMRELIKHNKYLEYSRIQMENYTHPDGTITELVNTNKLVRYYKGCDGGKTGFTNTAGFCLSATAQRGNMRVIGTVMGASDSKLRFKEVSFLFDYGFANYIREIIINEHDMIENTIEVKRGRAERIELKADKTISYLRKKGDSAHFEVDFEMPTILRAPISKGDVVGRVIVKSNDGNIIDQANIIAQSDISCYTLRDAIKKVVDDWFWKKANVKCTPNFN